MHTVIRAGGPLAHSVAYATLFHEGICLYILPLTLGNAQAAASRSATYADYLQHVRFPARGVAQAAVSSEGTICAHHLQSLCGPWHAAWFGCAVGAAAVSALSCAGRPLPPGRRPSCAVLWSPAAAPLIHPAGHPHRPAFIMGSQLRGIRATWASACLPTCACILQGWLCRKVRRQTRSL